MSLGAVTCNDGVSHGLGGSRPRLLVSVRDVFEAVDALDGGADWIDLKEPLAGPLGAVDAEVACQVVAAVAGRRPVSAALGELLDWPSSSTSELLELEGIEVVKLGLAGCGGQAGWQAAWQAAAEVVRGCNKVLVGVVYADWQQAEAPSPEEVVACVQAAQGEYLLIDTFDKQAGSVLEHFSFHELLDLLQVTKAASIRTVVAGSLSRARLADLPQEGIDLVAVRGAVCDGARTASVSRSLVADFRQAIFERWAETA